MTAQPKTKEDNMDETFTFEQLPYAKDALEPHIGAQTMELHHGKHYKGYIDKANELVKGTPVEGMPLEKAVLASHKQGGPLFNNIGQAYNHSVFWKSMKKDGGGVPQGTLADAINASFGSFDAFKEEFSKVGMSQFGSGWVWLVSNNGKIEIAKSANGESPLLEGKCPLAACDVWEHAYYLDYQNRRADYLKTFLDKVINWDFAQAQFDQSQTKGGSCGTSCGCG
jgi:Fe-Mn family superoxide dismutase